MTVLNVDQTIFWTQKPLFVFKFVVMERDILQLVMMVITLMETDAAKIVELKSASHAMEVHQTARIFAAQDCQLPLLLNQEDKLDYSEKLS